MAAIDHGADAVYMGGPGFGARAAACNSLHDVEQACRYAHQFGARLYVTLNTILFPSELEDAQRMVADLYQAGADALIVQDLALLRMHLPPIALHASTQMDTTTPEKAAWLESLGFSQIVVARELDLHALRQIAQRVTVPVEAFVHGALCVSYSGRCYASAHCFGRSANRGECAQFCRMKFDLIDADGRTLLHEGHLLSLRDMNRSASLEEMMDAGVRSFKIEGRLKGVDYVKNVTAYYRRALDAVLSRRAADYCRSSLGQTELTFEPRLERSFNRLFTEYGLHGWPPREPIANPFTPKSMGEPVGTVQVVGRRTFTLLAPRATQTAGELRLEAGDGLCFLAPGVGRTAGGTVASVGRTAGADEATTYGELVGFGVNAVRALGGGRVEVQPARMPQGLRAGQTIYRNADHHFQQILARPSARRRIGARLLLEETDEGYRLRLTAEDGSSVERTYIEAKQDARTPQRTRIEAELRRMGDTVFQVSEVELRLQGERFIPSSHLAAWRRVVAEAWSAARRTAGADGTTAARRTAAPATHRGVGGDVSDGNPASCILHSSTAPYTANIANPLAEQVMREAGYTSVEPAYEVRPAEGRPIMYTRHCLRRELGCCRMNPEHKGNVALCGGVAGLPLVEPLALRLADGRTFPLRFDCQHCQMLVMPSD